MTIDNELDDESGSRTKILNSESEPEVPAAPILEPMDEERFEESKETSIVQKIKSKPKKKNAKKGSEDQSFSKLQDEVQKQSQAIKKVDSAVVNIQKWLKSLDEKPNTKYDRIIDSVQKHVAEIERKVDRIDRSVKSTNSLTSKASKKKGKKKKGKKKKGKN